MLYKAVLFGATASLLAACAAPAAPRLKPSAKNFALHSGYRIDTLTLYNEGAPDSLLTWSITSKSERVTVTPSRGVLKGNDEDTVVIEVNQKGLSKGDVIHDTLLLSSEEGSRGVPRGIDISFVMTAKGFDACGAPAERAVPNVAPPFTPQRAPQTPYVPGELLVRYREPAALGVQEEQKLATQHLASAVQRDFGLTLKEAGGLYAPDLVRVDLLGGSSAGLGAKTSSTKSLDMEALAARLEKDPRVAYAEPNYYLHTLETRPNDIDLENQWNLLDFGLPQAWDVDTGEGRVVVAIIDSGVDTEHEDLASKMLPGCDFYDGDNDPSPGGVGASDHGTHVAGIAAAAGNNGLGIAGVAYGPGVKILPVKVFDDTGYIATTAELVSAVRWAAGLPLEGVAPNPNKADIINMSLGTGKGQIESINEVMKAAADAGVVLFAAAGNAGDSSGAATGNGVASPANAPSVIAVGAVNGDYRRAAFSDFATSGPTVDLMAPGGRAGAGGDAAVLSTVPDDFYEYFEGTSMASPFAAGVAALVLSQNPSLSPQQVKAKLVGSARFDASFMTKAEYGAGVVCADRALGAPTRCGR